MSHSSAAGGHVAGNPARLDARSLAKRLIHAIAIVFVRVALCLLPATRRNQKVVRSLWAGTPILNMIFMARGERLLGIPAETLVYRTYFITRQFDIDLSAWMRWPILKQVLPYAVFVWACCRYQRFHFFCDQGLLPALEHHQFNPDELRLLKSLGKEVYFWTYGGDVRTFEQTTALGTLNCCVECPAPNRSCICQAEKWRANYARLTAAADGIFAMGDMLEYTPGSRNDLFFWPVDVSADDGRKYAPRYPLAASDAPLRVVYAPNHRHFKGTRYLLAAAERLQQEGIPIELVAVEKVPNDAALDIYRTADIVFDQCLIGFHGYFALEAMALGKPVMVYIRKPQEYLLEADECPLVNSPANQVESVLRDLARDRRRLHELGVQGRNYIERHFTIEAFSERLRTAYRDLGKVHRAA